MNESTHIWCDGSYRPAHGTLGAAWVRAAEDGDLHPLQRSITLPKIQSSHAHGSDIAELTGFAAALEALPPGGTVTVHMDCRNVIDWLTCERVTSRDKQRENAVMRAFDRALAAKKRMATVTIVYTSDKNSPNMGLAHQLSRAASTPPKDSKAKVRKSRHAHQNSQYPARPRHA